MAPQVAILPVTPLQQNCSLIWDDETMRGALVDPGGDAERIEAAVAEAGFRVEKILITHGHLDHAGAAATLAAAYGVPIEGPHRDDAFLVASLDRQGARFGLRAQPFEPSRWLEDRDEVTVGHLGFRVRHCPGHTPGHVIFYNEPARLALVGDVLFRGSVGRSDLPGGDHDALIAAIRERLFPLGDDVTFVPGHGPVGTFGQERRSNPFVADALFA